jgi:hypothetical protein
MITLVKSYSLTSQEYCISHDIRKEINIQARRIKKYLLTRLFRVDRYLADLLPVLRKTKSRPKRATSSSIFSWVING